MVSLKRNVIANYASQIYMTLIGALLLPLYVKYMGAEAYGLVAFYTMLHAWFMLLDVGLTPTMTRETARFRGGSIDALALRRFLRTLEGIFIVIALIGAGAIMAGSKAIASHWLKVQHTPLREVQTAIVMMAAIMAMRWTSGLYKGSITGFEKLEWLGGFNIAIATLRFVLVIPIFIFVGSSPIIYFSYQLIVSVIELLVLITQTYVLMPKVHIHRRIPWEWEPLRGVLKFALMIAVASSIWVLHTQTDKLILSKLLPLSVYAYFTLAVLLASGISVISGPIGGAVVPRLVKMDAEGDDEQLLRLYRNATQMVCVIAIPASFVLAFFSRQVLWAWTGDAQIVATVAPVLTLYALGNGFLAVGAFPYFLQFAKGDLKLHLIGNVLFVVVMIPTVIWATKYYGIIGAGHVWLWVNVAYMVGWVPLIHRRLVKGLHNTWLKNDVAGIVLLAALCCALFKYFVVWPAARIEVALIITVISAVLVMVAGAASPWVRDFIHRKYLTLRV